METPSSVANQILFSLSSIIANTLFEGNPCLIVYRMCFLPSKQFAPLVVPVQIKPFLSISKDKVNSVDGPIFIKYSSK